MWLVAAQNTHTKQQARLQFYTDRRYTVYNYGEIAIKFDKPYKFAQHFENKVSLHLPENYELTAGARAENIHLYYDFITVAATGNAHHIKIIKKRTFKNSKPPFCVVQNPRFADANF